MTHSGGKPHTNIGDKGQRYEIRAINTQGVESVIGWATTVEGAHSMASAWRMTPSCLSTTIYDREAKRAIYKQYAGILR